VSSLPLPGLPQSVKEHVGVKERERGYDEATFVESFVVLNAAGANARKILSACAPIRSGGDDRTRTASPCGVAVLYAFHADEKILEAQQRRLPEQSAYIPEETRPLEGLGRVNRDLVQRCGERCPDQRIATVDQDATIIESHKQQALPTYEGCGLSAHAGGVGGDRSGAGGPVSRRQCSSADGAVGSRPAGFAALPST